MGLAHLDARIGLRIATQRDRALVGVGEALEVALELTDCIGMRVVLGLGGMCVIGVRRRGRKARSRRGGG